MINISAYICLLSALSVVEMKILNIDGRVGERVTFSCSDWDVWTDVTSDVKYFCDSPCTEDKHIIIKAEFGKTTHKDRIKLTNRAKGLSVTFTNLQKSDSKTYYCGVERLGLPDSYIKVNLQVRDAVSSSPKTTPKTVISSSTMSSSSSDIITEMSTSYTTFYSTTPTASATQGAGYVLYFIAGLIFIITVVMVGLILTRKMMKIQQMVVSTPQEDTRESAGPDEVYQSLHPLKMDNDQVYSTLTPTQRTAGPDEVYQSLHPLTMNNDQIYSTLTPTQRCADPNKVYQLLHPLTMENDQVYSNLTPTQRTAGPDEVNPSLHPMAKDNDHCTTNAALESMSVDTSSGS